MTSIGLEWETRALLLSLPIGAQEKKTAIEGDNWTLSFDKMEPSIFNNRIIEHGKDDCFYVIEVQMGPFFSKQQNNKYDETDINMVEDTVKKFHEYWKKIIEKRKIIFNGTEYDIVSYTSNINENMIKMADNNSYFKDCKLKIPGFYDLKESNNKMAYIKNLVNTTGQTQYTIGIKLENIVNMFRNFIVISFNYDKRQDKSKSICDNIKVIRYIVQLIITYYDTYIECITVGIDIRNVRVVGLIMLSNYFLICMIYMNSVYFKAHFFIKPRSNLTSIYNILEDNEKEMFDMWVKYKISQPTVINKEITSNMTDKDILDNMNIGKNFLDSIKGGKPNSEQGYHIKNQRGINSLAIHTITVDLKKYLSENEVKVEEVKYSYPFDKTPIKLTVIDEDTGKAISKGKSKWKGKGRIVQSKKSDVEFEVGEWGVGKNSEVYIEFRKHSWIIPLINNKIQNLSSHCGGNYESDSRVATNLSSVTKLFINEFVNKIFDNFVEGSSLFDVYCVKEESLYTCYDKDNVEKTRSNFVISKKILFKMLER